MKINWPTPARTKMCWKPIFNDLEFKTIIQRVFGDTAPSTAPVKTSQGSQLTMFGGATEIVSDQLGERKSFDASKVQYNRVENVSQLQSLAERLKEQTAFSVDSPNGRRQ